jgi:hypothetical protein
MKLSELEESESFNTNKITECMSELEQVFAKHNMNVGELLLTYGNLGYKLGANIRRSCRDKNFISEPPNPEELNKLYYSGQTEDVALMLTGLMIVTWVDNLPK